MTKKILFFFILLFVVIVTNAQTHEWAKSLTSGIGLGSTVQANSVIVDSRSNSYIVGLYRQDFTIENDTILYASKQPNQGIFNIYISKFDSTGKFIWIKTFYEYAINKNSPPSSLNLSNVKLISDNKILVSGSFSAITNATEVLKLGVSDSIVSVSNTTTVFYLIIDSVGKITKYGKIFQGTGSLSSGSLVNRQIDIDNQKNIYVSLSTSLGTIYSDKKNVTVNSTWSRKIVKFTDDFDSITWHVRIDSSTNPIALGIARIKVGMDNNIYLACTINKVGSTKIMIDGVEFSKFIPNDQKKGLLIILSPSGNFIHKGFINTDTTQQDNIFDVVAVDTNQIYLIGFVNDSILYGNQWFTSSGSPSNYVAYPYIAKISTIKANWIKLSVNKTGIAPFNNFFNSGFNGILNFDKHGYVYATFGFQNNTLSLSGLTDSTSGSAGFVKLDTLGNALWLRSGVNTTDMQPDMNSNLIYCGNYSGTLTLPPFTLNSQYGSGFVAKITDYTITRDSVFAGPYCAGDTIKVPYTITGTYDTSNYFVAELSDAFGDFEGEEYELGRLKTTEADTVKGLLPLFDVASSGKYRIRVRSTSPAVQSFYKLDSLKLLIYSKDTANAGLDRLICKGDSVELQSFGGTEWQWTPGNLTKDSIFWRTYAYPDSATEFRIIIRDSSGCGNTDTDYVKINLREPLEIKTPFSDTAICENQSIEFVANTFGGDTSQHYVWWYKKDNKKLTLLDSGIKTFSATCDAVCVIRTALYDTGYTFIAVLWDSCTAKKDTQIYILNATKDLELKIKINREDTNIFTDTVLCKNNVESITLYGSGTGGNHHQYNYSWFDINKNLLTTGDSFTFYPSLNTKYFAVLSDSCSLKNDTSYFDIFYDTLTAKVFSDNQKTQHFEDTVICEGQAVTLYGGGEGGASNQYSFEWWVRGFEFSNSDSVTITPTKNEEYFVIISDNCSLKNDTFFFKININPALNSEIINQNNKATFPKDTTICFGQTIKLISKNSGGDSSKYSYRWAVDVVQFSNADTFSYTFLEEKTSQKIQFILTDNCTTKSDTNEINIFTKEKLKIEATIKDTFCLNENYIVKTNASGGDSTKYSFQFSVGGLQFSNADTGILPTNNIGKNTLKIVLKDGCSIPNDSITKDYFVMDSLKVTTIISDTFCAGTTVNATALASGGNPLKYSFEWWVGGAEFSNTQNLSYKISQNEEGKLNEIKVKISDNCSQNNDSFIKNIFVTNPLKVSLSVDSNCVNNKAKITANISGGKEKDYNFEWFVNDIFKENNTSGILNFADNKDNKIKVKVDDNCSQNKDSAELILQELIPKIIAQINPTEACEPMEITLKITNENGTKNTYNWSVENGEILNNISVDSATYNYQNSGTFIGYIKAKTSQNCEADFVLETVFVHPLPIVDFTWNPSEISLPDAEVDFQNLSNENDKFNWQINDSNFSNDFNTKYIFNDSGFYTIKLIAQNEFNCLDSSIKKLFVKDLVSVFIPNVFTPNGDDLNDEFTPIVTGIESYEIQIYNRWGQQVFEGNMNQHWNGKYNNTNVPDGSYLYQIRLLRIDKKVIYLNGSVNVLR